MNYYISRNEVQKLISGATTIGFIKGLEYSMKFSRYISQNKAYTIFNKSRVKKWVSEGLIVPKHGTAKEECGKNRTILYDIEKLYKLDLCEEIRIEDAKYIYKSLE